MNLSLIGFMGSGKSTIASRLADNLGFDFVDTDALIEKTALKSINEIFNDEGEGVFRKLECQVLEDLVGREGLVIATGGGIVTNKRNLRKFSGDPPETSEIPPPRIPQEPPMFTPNPSFCDYPSKEP